MQVNTEMTVRELVDAIGRAEIMDACRVNTQAVTNWISDERIPPKRYPTIRDLCAARGIETPENLFFKSRDAA